MHRGRGVWINGLGHGVLGTSRIEELEQVFAIVE